MAPNEEERRASEEKTKDENEGARREMEEFMEADELPSDLSEWPDGKAKFLTIGGSNDHDPYGEGVTSKLGPADVVHHPGGAVSVGGKEVDNPEDFKGEPIPGGPTDPNSPAIAGERKRASGSEGAPDDDQA